jgi:hypothetical protein
MASMGATDKRLVGKSLDYHLSQQLAGYRRADPAPTHVTPASLRLIDYGYEVARLSGAALLLATVDMAYIGFFYLNRPGEYSKPTSPDSLSTPFRLCDIELSIGSRVFKSFRRMVAAMKMSRKSTARHMRHWMLLLLLLTMRGH